MSNRAVLLLGSNVDKERNLPAAVRLLRQACRVMAVSPVYQTAAVGLVDQPDFFNAAVLVETDLDAVTLKRELLAGVEQMLDRRRLTNRHAPRTIDIDLILFNDDSFALGRRQVPDPDLQRFMHVAVPVAQVVPHWRHPASDEPLPAIARRLIEQARANGQRLPRERPDIDLAP